MTVASVYMFLLVMFSVHSCICFYVLLWSGICNEEIRSQNIFSANGQEDLIKNNVISMIHNRMDKEAIKKSLDDFTMARRKTHLSIPGNINNGNPKNKDTVSFKNNIVDIRESTDGNNEITTKYNENEFKLQDLNKINEKEDDIKRNRAEYVDPMDLAGKNDVELLYDKYKENNFESVLTPEQEIELLKVYNKQKELLRNIKAIDNKNKITTTKKVGHTTTKTTPKKTTTKRALTTKKTVTTKKVVTAKKVITTTKSTVKPVTHKTTAKVTTKKVPITTTVPKKTVKTVATTKATTKKHIQLKGQATENDLKVEKLLFTIEYTTTTEPTTSRTKKRRTTEQRDEVDFYDLVADMEKKNEAAKKLSNYTPFTFETTTTTKATISTTRASTVLTILNEVDVRAALKNDPFVQRILQMANRKRQKYMEKALINIVN